MKFPFCLLPAALAAGLAGSAAAEGFSLGVIEIVGSRSRGDGAETVIDRDRLDQFNRDNAGAALTLAPGVSVVHNGRNEDIVYLRGFDVRQVPLFIDGVPTYVPYDGYVDFGRFTTFDLAEIRVAKGAASLLYGPNALGGAINLVSRKPSRAFEGEIRTGFASGNERKLAVNLGGRGESGYYQLSASYLDADNFPLSKDFRRTAGEDGGARDNAYRRDKKLSLKVGVIPSAGNEFALGFVRQEGEKGNPPYAGTAPGGLRYWRWPYWDVESVYAVGRLALGERHGLKWRVYDDTYRNSIRAYTDAAYTSQINNTSFPSWYDDGSRGASFELASDIWSGHVLRLAYHYKQDRHKESNPSIPSKQFEDVTTSLAFEDLFRLGRHWRLRLGASHDRRETREAYTYAKDDAGKNNWLAELSRAFGDTAEFYASLARKSRFPTIKDRYSFRLGTALANPALRPETALNAELGISGRPWGGAHVQAAVFRSRIEDLMQSVVVPAPGACAAGPTPNVTCNQLQNVGRARHQGIELDLQQQLGQWYGEWRGGASYTYLERRNESNPAIPLTDTPRHKVFAHLEWRPADAWRAQLTLDSEQGRTVSYGNGYTVLGGFTVLGAKAIWQARPDTRVEIGVNNLLDENYALADGYPLPGRTWFVNAHYRF